MSDLDIRTAQLIIQLARDDIYGLDDDEIRGGGRGGGDSEMLSDLEFALAEQEREFMQYWMDYGDAQVTPHGARGGGSGGGGGGGAVASSSGTNFYPPLAAGGSGSSSSSSSESSSSRSPTSVLGGLDIFDPILEPTDEIHHHAVMLQVVSRTSSPSMSSLASVQIFPIRDISPIPSIHSSPRLPIFDDEDDFQPEDGEEDIYATIYDHEPFVVQVEPNVECFFCKELCASSSTFTTPCNHNICRPCITRNIEICMRDETTYPPKCCEQRIPLAEMVNMIQDVDLREKYEAKCVEYDTLIRDRVYCWKCGDFLGSKMLGCVGPAEPSPSSSSPVLVQAATSRSTKYCLKCFVATCTSCKQLSHPTRSCEETPSEIALKKLARERGWQTCPNCQAVVELFYGCYHIKCRCTTEFCYLCATRWKGCNCNTFDEDRLIALGAQVLQ